MFKVLSIITLLFATSLPALSKPAGSVWLSGGANQEGNFSGAIGARAGIIGAEVGVVGGGSSIPSGTLDYSIPHTFFTDIGSFTSNAYGVDLLFFADLNEQKTISLYAGPGIYNRTTTDVVESLATGWKYQNGSTENFVAAGSGGIKVMVGKKLEIGAGYHSVRGIQGSIGIRY